MQWFHVGFRGEHTASYNQDQFFNLFKSDLYNTLLFLAFKTLFI